MRFTDTYHLGSVVAGEPLNPLEDSRRFLVIDRQLLGLFQVFGNGIVTGWELSSAGGLQVGISPGRGHVDFFSGVTTDVRTVTVLPNAVNYIYVQSQVSTGFDRNVQFLSSVVLPVDQVILGAVTTNSVTITSFDLSQRTDISFIEEIKSLINQHRHRGGSTNPTKIDLSKEVMGQLPGFRIDNIDASKVTTGVLNPSRIPLLEHSDLAHSGVLTHAQLDSFVRSLSSPNARLLGEISGINMLQLYLAMKHIWNDVDAYSSNLLVMIPGITPDSFTDFNKTTAVVDKTNHLIQGVPSIGGALVTTTYSTDADFSSAIFKSNVDIGTDLTGDFFKITKPLNISIVESFDNVFTNNVAVPGWTLETIASQSTTSFVTDSTRKLDGPFSAKLNVDESIRVQVTKVFSKSQDWTPYNEVQAAISCLSAAHGKIILQMLKKVGSDLQEVDSFVLLDTNETTVGFRTVIRDITSDDRAKIDAIRIYTDTALGWDLSTFNVNIDSIQLNNNLFFNPSAKIRFRLKTPQKAHWAAISWVGDTNGGTIQARARSAPSFETFDQSSSSPFNSYFSVSGGDPKVDDNRAFEFEIALAASAGLTQSPVLRSVTASYITASTSGGITVDTANDFLRATKMVNSSVLNSGDVIINGRIDVGDVYYGGQHSVQQSSLATLASTGFGSPVVGFDGSALPLSPIQASQNNLGLRQSSIDGAASVQRLPDRNYLVADALNDRIVIFNRDGQLIKGFISNNVRNQQDLYPLSTVYNPVNTTLYIAWSSNVSLQTLDVSKIIISGAGLSLTLSNSSDKTIRLTGPKTQNDTSNVTGIVLSPTHASEISAFLQGTTGDQRLFIDIAADAAKQGLNLDNQNFSTLVTPRGLPLFVGDIKFISGLFRPINISITSTGTWLVCNAKPLLTDSSGADILTGVSPSEVASIIEIDPATGAILFSDSSVDFSLLTLGGAVEFNSRYIAEAGIVEGKGAPTQTTTNSTKATVGGGVVQTNSTVTTSNTSTAKTTSGSSSSGSTTTTTKTDVDILSDRRGIIKIVERKSGRVIFQQETSDGTYAADIQLDADGNIVTIEKTFASDGTASGRVIKLDDDGNIFFQFGLAELASPNDVRVLLTGNMVVST